MEEEVRRILKEALRPAEAPSGLGKRLRDRFAGLAAEEFDVPKRHAPRSAPQWDEPVVILLDTNVLSEFMRPRPSARVVSWLDEQPAGEVYTSAISRQEIELGLMLMPPGKRQEALSQAA